MKVTDIEKGCFLLRFSNQQDYIKALLEVPWNILGHYLLVHPWSPNVDPCDENLTSGLTFYNYHKIDPAEIGGVYRKVH
ncbi:hypothetical protein Sjap_012302 [Stephania japonica]|uniref:DUF4283 domain-containing protein n=1 Tax=Stephania japonica TaxID=461633 RepID=A0AAP0IWX0_9MAGN